ncbi:LuxR C-terminal-related transcriptional regulator [Nocardia gamkensis]|uniref:LuxR C-terminal-related transcriptional regulator n=1 Tax=Nocardia gamkensis TaxID=352869 RepID=UPI0033CFAAC6
MAATSEPGSIDLVARICELNTRVGEPAERAGRDAANRSLPQLLDATMARANQCLDFVRAGTATAAEMSELVDELATVQAMLRGNDPMRSGDTLRRLFAALERMRRRADADQVLDSAPEELCAACGFDRAMISLVQGSIWLPRRLHLSEEHVSDDTDRELVEYLTDLEIALASPLVEAEVVRRRLPALVGEAQHEERAFGPLMRISRTREYVVAPIVVGSVVLGLLHADTYRSGRPLALADRDSVRIFAEGVGLVYERAVLRSRLSRQRDHLAETMSTLGRIADMSIDESVRLPNPATRVAVAIPPSTGRSTPDPLGHLTGREREVLTLLAGGATNAQVADQLTVAESTVKSHVKHILHKLGAPNRAGAIARYVRASNSDDRRW